jgi:hypothetical protein
MIHILRGPLSSEIALHLGKSVACAPSGALFLRHIKNYESLEFRHLFCYIFQNIARLTIQNFANSFQSIETDALRFSRFEDGQIGRCDVQSLRQFLALHLAFGEHHIYIYNNWHNQIIKSCSV